MKPHLTRIALGIFMTSVLLTACEKDNDPEENEEELITTMKLTFTPTGGTPFTYEFSDPDGPGGTDPTKDEIVLAPSTTYNVSVQLLNESETPAEDITLEVQAEDDAHRFYYQPSGGSNITVSGLNNDSGGMPLGITSTWTTGAAATGSIIVTLRHYPGNPPGKAVADPVDSPKSGTDITATFDTRIQ